MSGQSDRGQFDIVIIGAGMVGATLALMLHQKIGSAQTGRAPRVAVLESAEINQKTDMLPGYDGRSLALSWGSRNILKSMNLWDKLRAHAEAIETVHVSERGRMGSVSFRAADEGLPALGYVIDSEWLGRIFNEELLGCPDTTLLCPVHVERLEHSASGSRLTVRSEQNTLHKLTADLVIIADGGRSSLYRQPGFTKEVYEYGHHAIVTTVKPDRHHRQIAYERFTDEGSMALLPLGYGRCGVVWTMPEALAEERMQLADKDFIAEFQHRFGYRAGFFAEPGKRLSHPLTRSLAKEQLMPGFLLLGSAAHHLHPVAGQGFNLCLRDINALADVLNGAFLNGKSPGSPEVLHSYMNRQSADQKLTADISHYLVECFTGNGHTARDRFMGNIRSAGMLALGAVRPLKSAFLRKAMQLSGERI